MCYTYFEEKGLGRWVYTDPQSHAKQTRRTGFETGGHGVRNPNSTGSPGSMGHLTQLAVSAAEVVSVRTT